MRPWRTAVLVLILATLAACSAGAETGGGASTTEAAPTSAPTAEPPAASVAVDAAALGADELGEIPVLMFHRVVQGGGGEYDLSPEEFRAELEYLYEHGYRPIRTVDLVDGHVDVPAGTTPVVLTFDDSSREQLAYTEHGEIDPASAVGMLLAFAEEHPDFPAVASLYVNDAPFGGVDSERALRDLHELGFELGNHTARHSNLRSLDPAGVAEDLARGAQVITDAVPQAQVRTLALPHGISPEPRELAVSGEHDGVTFAHDGILLIGAQPASSPFSQDFDPIAIPRIRSTPGWDGGDPDFTSGYWFAVLEREPERRFVSDGDPDTISFPRTRAGELAGAYADRANPYDP